MKSKSKSKFELKADEPLRNAVVVITGASSGIGRATALEFANRGASVVLAARREDALQELAAECEAKGAHAIAVPTDVSNEDAVNDLARQAVRRFNRIDIWVNNAGVSAAGRLEQLPTEVFRRIIDVNLFGAVHGAKAALPYFREQGHGVLINVAAQFGKMGASHFAPYSISKFGVVSLGECLRQELADTGIEVCTVMPATIDTPFFQHAGSYAGRPVKPMTPIYDVQKVADTIVDLAENPKREVFVGRSASRMNAVHTATPGAYEKMAARKVPKEHFENRPTADNPGNLFEPMPEGTGTDGGWKRRQRAKRMRNVSVAIGSVAVPVLAWFFARNRSRFSRRTGEDPGRSVMHFDPEMEMPDPQQVERDIAEWEKKFGQGKKDPAA